MKSKFKKTFIITSLFAMCISLMQSQATIFRSKASDDKNKRPEVPTLVKNTTWRGVIDCIPIMEQGHLDFRKNREKISAKLTLQFRAEKSLISAVKKGAGLGSPYSYWKAEFPRLNDEGKVIHGGSDLGPMIQRGVMVAEEKDILISKNKVKVLEIKLYEGGNWKSDTVSGALSLTIKIPIDKIKSGSFMALVDPTSPESSNIVTEKGSIFNRYMPSSISMKKE